MGQGLGIGAMIVAILAIFVPVVGIYVVWGALVLATVAALMGDRVYPVVTVIITIVNVVFLSPLILAAFSGEEKSGESFFFYVTIVLIIAPIATMIISVVTIGNKKEPEGEE